MQRKMQSIKKGEERWWKKRGELGVKEAKERWSEEKCEESS